MQEGYILLVDIESNLNSIRLKNSKLKVHSNLIEVFFRYLKLNSKNSRIIRTRLSIKIEPIKKLINNYI